MIEQGEEQKNALKDSFCMKKVKGRILLLYWSLLFIAAGVVCIISSIYSYGNMSDDWGALEYAVSIAIFIIGIGCILGAIYEGYSNVRDFFFPAKSRLAASIRSQLDFPDEAPELNELFGMVDRDIAENGHWFDSTAVGREWVLCDDAFALSRIRTVFKRDEIIERRVKRRVQTVRVTELYIIDDRRQLMVIPMKNHNELEPLVYCLKFNAPDALFLPYEEYMTYLGKTDDEWETLEREFQFRKSRRELEKGRDKQPQEMTLYCTDGLVTSRVDSKLLHTQIKSGFEGTEGESFLLTPNSPVEIDGMLFCQMQCRLQPVENAESLDEGALFSLGRAELLLKSEPEKYGAAPTDGYLLETDGATCERILNRWLTKGRLELDGWANVLLMRSNAEPQEKKRYLKLFVTEKNGLEHSYHNVLRADIELAGRKLADGSYSAVELDADGDYLLIQGGNSEDGRATVQTSGFAKGKVRAYEIKCRPKQAEEWLMQLYDGEFAPDLSQWKDITRRLDKLAKKLAKNSEK